MTGRLGGWASVGVPSVDAVVAVLPCTDVDDDGAESGGSMSGDGRADMAVNRVQEAKLWRSVAHRLGGGFFMFLRKWMMVKIKGF